jgi:hypothetical protein
MAHLDGGNPDNSILVTLLFLSLPLWGKVAQLKTKHVTEPVTMGR